MNEVSILVFCLEVGFIPPPRSVFGVSYLVLLDSKAQLECVCMLVFFFFFFGCDFFSFNSFGSVI